jgi:uncharacterized membrane protein YfbV (UPF0208 family)
MLAIIQVVVSAAVCLMGMVVFHDRSPLPVTPLVAGWFQKFLMTVVLRILVVDSILPMVDPLPKAVVPKK